MWLRVGRLERPEVGKPDDAGKDGGNGVKHEVPVTASVAEKYGDRPVAARVAHALHGPAEPRSALEAVDDLLHALYEHDPAAVTLLAVARDRSVELRASVGGGRDADRLAASHYAADVLVELAAERLLRDGDAVRVAAQLAVTSPDGSTEATLLELYTRAVANPLFLDLPPLFALESQLSLLVSFGLAESASLWTRSAPTAVRCVLQVGADETSRRERASARLAVTGGVPVSLSRRSAFRAAPVFRWQRAEGAVVARLVPERRDQLPVCLSALAAAVSPILERAMLLERSSERERTVSKATERRLTRLGFDLHDGPIQEIVALGGELHRLREELYPFVAAEQREQAYERLEELGRHVGELHLELRELAHSLESKSVVSRPLEEVLHREVDTFVARTGIQATLTIEGSPSFLTDSQRITIFRAVQEALTNVREHSGALSAAVTLRCRRGWTELRIHDDGRGFNVESGLTSAAKRGRLGVIGISERVRLVGGRFELDSAPGGPTVLSITLPRFEPLELDA